MLIGIRWECDCVRAPSDQSKSRLLPASRTRCRTRFATLERNWVSSSHRVKKWMWRDNKWSDSLEDDKPAQDTCNEAWRNVWSISDNMGLSSVGSLETGAHNLFL